MASILETYMVQACTLLYPQAIDLSDPTAVPAEGGSVSTKCRAQRRQRRLAGPDGLLTVSDLAVDVPVAAVAQGTPDRLVLAGETYRVHDVEDIAGLWDTREAVRLWVGAKGGDAL